MELNREQIINALECCLVESNCRGCPLHHQYETDCLKYAGEKALKLIKQLTEENERLRGIIEEARGYKDELERILPCAFANEKADALNTLQTMFAMRFGTYTDKDMTPISEVFRLLDKFIKEMLEV